jgi:hypothetical protein
VEGQRTEEYSLPNPCTKLEDWSTKQTEMEEDNWGGHDLNIGQSAIGEERSYFKIPKPESI